MRIFVMHKSVVITACIALFLSVFVTVFFVAEDTPTAGEAGKDLPIYSVETEDRKVAVTFNCAWNDTDIDKILACLAERNVKCTFFAVGTWLEKYPEAAKKLVAAGHELASHSYNHAHYNQLSKEEMLADMEKCDALLADLGAAPGLFRAPYGEYNALLVQTCKESGRYTIQWDIDSLDWKGISPQEMENRILPRLRCGSIILFHNGTEQTADALPAILDRIISEGYACTTVGELIYREDYIINHEGRQNKIENIESIVKTTNFN
ncbi:MAG: polysaccharide deacetylase family protein [Clostridia bacterium]|nr:polysaccharide deacetylase family protein [Clostridia bacterium]